MGALKFRVLLDTEQETEIFRDILIDERDNFESLYHAIISAFRFQGDQMASFYMSNEDWDKGHEISLMDLNYGDEAIDEKASLMSAAVIADFIEVTDQKIILVYDFLRMWIFLIELLEHSPEPIDKPQVLMSIGMAPPEDSRMADFDEDEEDITAIGEDEFGDDEEWKEDELEDGYDEEDYRSYDDY